jgi:hypothetical protein
LAFRLSMNDIIRATLPRGWGYVGFLGVNPAGDSYHVMAPVEIDLAADVFIMALDGQAEPLGGRPGWRYYYCHTYEPPPQDGRPWPEALLVARRQRARHSGELFRAWARRQGWWVEFGGGVK